MNNWVAEKLGRVIQGFTGTKEKICVMAMVSKRRPIWHAKSGSFIVSLESTLLFIGMGMKKPGEKRDTAKNH